MNIIYISFIVILLLLTGRKLHRRKRNKKRVVQVIEDNCVRCGSCLKECRHHVLDMVNDAKGVHIMVKYPDKCAGSGDCISACNFHALELVDRDDKN